MRGTLDCRAMRGQIRAFLDIASNHNSCDDVGQIGWAIYDIRFECRYKKLLDYWSHTADWNGEGNLTQKEKTKMILIFFISFLQILIFFNPLSLNTLWIFHGKKRQ